ncbi:fatty acid desaturase-domain-containing protein [Desarmillaria tabescens]|uniref:Fatty acid desaturase-domain-containing protein n=1 Tax=Armillaria tabescens TaxID=1929756 RepID=A0AA39NGD7_ARMTA|nr:fatty acid desaturase-domain-containing protein [Desarmillaria tabescens]KAK0465151.1 fatty acid desaturase-domain-containing protein [Desarmillaria tabescens]
MDSPEYLERRKTPFSPPTVTLKEIHDAVPKHLLKGNPVLATLYVLRDISFTLLLFKLASRISDVEAYLTSPVLGILVKSFLWLAYWWVQGLVWAGIFCLGHDAGHGTLYRSTRVNNLVGFVLHTALLIPYYAWRATHHAHHKATSSMERDENYVPYLRSDYGLPSKEKARQFDYDEVFEETPIYTLSRMLIMQGLGWWVYLAKNTMGSKMYSSGTNHFDPDSPLFKPEQRNAIIISDIGLIAMVLLLTYAGPGFFFKYYLVPYLLTNHWSVSPTLHLSTVPSISHPSRVMIIHSIHRFPVMFTYLHHSDPTIPHYRKAEWSFLRGAAATVDRPLLGWMGRFFFHNISHDHVAHHFFSSAPFYNGPAITQVVKNVLGDSYNYDSTPSFYALYRSFTQCLFVEEEGDIVFYKNKNGEAAREVAYDAVKRIRVDGWNPVAQDELDEKNKEE